jgi:hypothetical protein
MATNDDWFTFHDAHPRTILRTVLSRDCHVEVVIRGRFTAAAHHTLTQYLALMADAVDEERATAPAEEE